MTAPAPEREASGKLTHASILAIALPIIIANVTTPMIGMVDTAVVGQLGAAHQIGAVAIGAMIFNMVYWAFGFLRMGTTGLTAQAEGRGDASEVAAALIRALLIAALCGTALVAMQWPISALAFVLVEGSDPVEAGAASYFGVRIWGAPAALANYAFLGWFIGQGRAGTALLLQLLLNGTNAALDALFVLGLGWGVEGVAVATVIAEVIAAGCGLWIALRLVAPVRAGLARAHILESRAVRRVASVNADILIRSLCLLFAFSWFTAKSAQVSDVTLAANAILLHFSHFCAYFLDGFAFSTETLVGQAVGARRHRRFREAVRMSSLWATVLAVMLGAVFLVLGGPYIDLLSVNPEVRAEARLYLLWAALAPIAGVACFQLDGIFIGATRTADMRNMMVIAVAVYLAAWAVLTDAFGNHGLWAALIVFYVARAVTLGARYPALERAAFPQPPPLARAV